MNDRELLRAMDACRPGSDDLNLPEIQSLKTRLATDVECQQAFRHRQRLDRELPARLCDVPVPLGLRQRILEGLESGASTAVELLDSRTSGAAQDVRVAPRPRLSRRRIVAVAVGLIATAASFFLVLTAFRPAPTEQITPSRLAGWAIDRWVPDPQAWKAYDSSQAGQLYPLSRFMRTSPARWQQLSTELDRQAVVYELDAIGPTRVRLYVLNVTRRLPQLPTRPPEDPLVGSRGWYTAAWQEVPHVYVLAMEGAPESYYDLLRPGSPSLATRGPGSDLNRREVWLTPVLCLTQPVRSSRG